MISLLFGLAVLVGTALFNLGVFLIVCFAITWVVNTVTNWLNSDELQQVDAMKSVSMKSEVIQSLIADASKGAASQQQASMYQKLGEAFATGTKIDDIVSLTQNQNGDVAAATSIGAKSRDRQREDARDYTLATDRFGNELYKSKIIS